jgi:drug/metabolite transporter (DMT)-like permease
MRGSSAGSERKAPREGRAVSASPRESAWIGPLCAVLGVLGFSLKAIFIKLVYAGSHVDPVTLLALRMLYAAPFFLAIAWWSGRQPGTNPIAPSDWRALAALGFIGYYFSSLLDFIGLQYISAALERLVLFLNPTIVVVLSALFLRKPITGKAVLALALAYAGIALCLWQSVRIGEDLHATALGSALVFGSALCYAMYLVGSSRVIARLGSSRFIAWAMLASTVFVLVHFGVARPLGALSVPASVHRLALAMAIVATVLPTWLIAESIRRMGASAASLVGSLGPVFTMGIGAVVLGEPVFAVQLAGAALVLGGVLLVTMKPSPAAKVG